MKKLYCFAVLMALVVGRKQMATALGDIAPSVGPDFRFTGGVTLGVDLYTCAPYISPTATMLPSPYVYAPGYSMSGPIPRAGWHFDGGFMGGLIAIACIIRAGRCRNRRGRRIVLGGLAEASARSL